MSMHGEVVCMAKGGSCMMKKGIHGNRGCAWGVMRGKGGACMAGETSTTADGTHDGILVLNSAIPSEFLLFYC